MSEEIQATEPNSDSPELSEKANEKQQESGASIKAPREIGGPKGPEPTRYGDWERGGRCSDF